MTTRFWDKLASKVTWLLLLLLIIYVARMLAHATWFGLGEHSDRLLQIDSRNVSVAAGTRQENRVLPLDIFGRVDIKLVQKEEVRPTDAPKTMLRLELNGVFLSDSPQRSAAIIAERGKDSEYYRVGDSLPGNVLLDAVYPNYVILNRAGKFEKLIFDEDKADGGNITLNQSTPQGANAGVRINTPEEFVAEATRRLSDNPVSALASVGLRPASSDEVSGYVFEGNNPMLTRLNLKRGDVIRSVNGNGLGDLQRDKDLLQQLSSQDSLEVEVERDGTSFYINYPLRR
ncbi:MAG: general secretion pathway protein GspC [Hahellaceae bacterium]|nr:general secretion pathway protein GspC [Hahellaceae bacterium]